MDSRSVADEVIYSLTAGSYESLSAIIEGLVSADYSTIFGENGDTLKVIATFPQNVVVVNNEGVFKKVPYFIYEDGTVGLGASENLNVPIITKDNLDKHIAVEVQRAHSVDDPDLTQDRIRHLLELQTNPLSEHEQLVYVEVKAKMVDNQKWESKYKDAKSYLSEHSNFEKTTTITSLTDVPLEMHEASARSLYESLEGVIHKFKKTSMESFAENVLTSTKNIYLLIQEAVRSLSLPRYHQNLAKDAEKTLPVYAEAISLLLTVADHLSLD